jgi:hypothetical protein
MRRVQEALEAVDITVTVPAAVIKMLTVMKITGDRKPPKTSNGMMLQAYNKHPPFRWNQFKKKLKKADPKKGSPKKANIRQADFYQSLLNEGAIWQEMEENQAKKSSKRVREIVSSTMLLVL